METAYSVSATLYAVSSKMKFFGINKPGVIMLKLQCFAKIKTSIALAFSQYQYKP